MKKATPYLAVGLAIVAITILLILHKEQRRFDGRLTLNPAHSLPYGSAAAYRLLQQQFPKAKVAISKDAPGDWTFMNDSMSVLFILNEFFNPTGEELDSLLSFARKGNFVFISAQMMNGKAQHFFGVGQPETYRESDANESDNKIRLSNPFALRLDSSSFAKPISFNYPGAGYDNYFNQYDDRYAYPLGYNALDSVNLLAIRTRKGAFLLHSAPVTFTNLFLLYHNNHLYFEKLISLMPAATKQVMWDEYFMYHKPADDTNDNSILHVLLKYPNFRRAFWLSLAAIALYIVTEAKRRQRFTPEYMPPPNETMNFVSTIGKLYYERGDHKNLANKLSLYFLEFVRSRYKIQITELNENFIQTLSLKSSVPPADINAVVTALNHIKNSNAITGEELLDYHTMLQNFYTKV